jgi:hypothetical protein
MLGWEIWPIKGYSVPHAQSQKSSRVRSYSRTPSKELLTPIARKVKISHERYYRRELGAQGLRP